LKPAQFRLHFGLSQKGDGGSSSKDFRGGQPGHPGAGPELLPNHRLAEQAE
jgi:hypothetical protein